jgi:hypothetical protein
MWYDLFHDIGERSIVKVADVMLSSDVHLGNKVPPVSGSTNQSSSLQLLMMAYMLIICDGDGDLY